MSRMHLIWQPTGEIEYHGTVYAVDDSFDHEFGTERRGHLEVEDLHVWVFVPYLMDWYAITMNDKLLENRKAEFLEWAQSINREAV